jgi:hypothetical protein
VEQTFGLRQLKWIVEDVKKGSPQPAVGHLTGTHRDDWAEVILAKALCFQT